MAAFPSTRLIVFVVMATLILPSEQINLDGVDCAAGPYLDHNVPIKENGHYVFTPYSVAVNRCSGTNGVDSPSLRSCVATETDKVTVSVTRRTNKEKTTVQVENHKQCAYQCKYDGSQCTGDSRFYKWDNTTCQCKCDYKWEIGHWFCPADAHPPREWSDEFCGCKCKLAIPCPEGSVVNETDCSCRATCKEGAIVRTTTDPQASTGKKPGPESTSKSLLNQQLTVGTLIIALVIQAVVILIFFAVAQAIGACRRDSRHHKGATDVEMKQPPPHKFDRELTRTPSRPDGYVNEGITR